MAAGDLTVRSEQHCFGGTQGFYSHQSALCGCEMSFSVFQPPAVASGAKLPLLTYLSGLTCTEENFTTKAGFQRVAAELGMMVLAPDTSPRGLGLPGEDAAYDFGSGAGFYVDSTQEPWSKNYRMYSYITQELPALITANFPVDMSRQGITGHSMGGHGALTIHLKNPETYSSVSAFAPISAPSQCPWGEKALGGYLGDDRESWQAYDSCALIRANPSKAKILVDQGGGDNFLEEQLRPDLLQAACDEAGQALELRLQPGYDHSYYFIASFVEDHLRHHAATLCA